ncbi:putative pectate lyase 21 [Hibiscus syriacus]|uniref:putative pectate lyase 21 n=1 Tax=Hibiscus syriacus TaxID=106335 RepID=UPI0019204627|nr:putative pectate lyase 21 [Hibiscus syriacus]
MTIFYLLSLLLCLHATSTFSIHTPRKISEAVPEYSTRRQLDTEQCATGNPIDDCWRCDPEWESNRKKLADCAVGFGKDAIGGRDGEIYVVTDPGDGDPISPTPGTLRHAAIQPEPLWIIFDHDMVISLRAQLLINSYKTVDGRGHDIEITNGPCMTLRNVSNVIIHNIYIHDCLPSGDAMVWNPLPQYAISGGSDGDAISIFGSRDVWIDHCTLAKCYDGLIDATYGSTSITISNNYMLHHNEVMLMGHSDEFLDDKNMQVTIAFNYFGEGLVQRMPRCRHGYFHIVNNVYVGWEMYAIGGSANPTINSEGNVFIASDNNYAKEVTKRESSFDEWSNWNWRSEGDMMANGAFFTPSGEEGPESYIRASSMVARPTSLITKTAQYAGILSCRKGYGC